MASLTNPRDVRIVLGHPLCPTPKSGKWLCGTTNIHEIGPTPKKQMRCLDFLQKKSISISRISESMYTYMDIYIYIYVYIYGYIYIHYIYIRIFTCIHLQFAVYVILYPIHTYIIFMTTRASTRWSLARPGWPPRSQCGSGSS